ncbi:MAG: PD-(D/E)XK nuclease family protein [Cryomorphaceae bacterium]|nr:PD-(D/E)XK nuclease family protein [Cryomorphaceae bacterium]
MKTFLQHTAANLIQQFGDDLHEQFIVIPNLRPAIFLRKAIAGLIEKPTLSPTILSIEELVFSLTDLKKASSTESLFRLYESFCAKSKSHFSIEEFMGIGPTVLNDFYEVDLYLADPKDLFNYLSDIRKIEQWAPDNPEGKSGEYAKKYLAFYASLYEIYADYRHKLREEKHADPALAFRTLAENRAEIFPLFFEKHPNSQLIFVGFNALTPAEETFMKYTKRMGKSQFFWDADQYYVNDKKQEAGLFFRNMDEALLPPKDRENFPKNIGNNNLHVTSVETTGNIQQVLFAAEKVAEWTEAAVSEEEQVAIVLGNESLISDLVQMLPTDAKVNLTLGLPLDQLQAGQLLYAYTRMMRYPEKKAIYHKDLVRFLQHPFIRQFLYFSGTHKNGDELLQAIATENHIYVGKSVIQRFFAEHPKWITWLTAAEDNLSMANQLADLIENLCIFWDQAKSADENYEREQTYAALHLVREASVWIEKYFLQESPKVVSELIWQLTKVENISFRGEPETGIQIMGILETRLLHFDRVLLLSTNEDIIPQGKSQYSLIPLDVKKHFDLPWHTHKDAIFAYHFYHLFHGCHQAELVYTQGGSGLGNAGPSRFLYQIEWEWAQLKNITFSKTLYYAPLKSESEKKAFVIENVPMLRDKLEKQFSEKGISPSALRMYLRDPIQFYSEYVLGIRNEDLSAEEDAGLPAIGNAVHKVLEEVYKPYINAAFPDEQQLKSMQKNAIKMLKSVLQSELGNASLDEGKNIIALTAAEEMVRHAIQFDMQNHFSGREIIALENNGEKLHFDLPVETKYGPVKLTGIVDRLERWGEDFVYIDYKTGNIPNRLVWPDDPYAIDAEKRNDKLGPGLQLLCYSTLAGQPDKNFQLALLGLKKRTDGYQWLQDENKNRIHKPKLRGEFVDYLADLIAEILTCDFE